MSEMELRKDEHMHGIHGSLLLDAIAAVPSPAGAHMIPCTCSP
jgi:hypothetical protein